jgi:hypothetical protein
MGSGEMLLVVAVEFEFYRLVSAFPLERCRGDTQFQGSKYFKTGVSTIWSNEQKDFAHKQLMSVSKYITSICANQPPDTTKHASPRRQSRHIKLIPLVVGTMQLG